MGGFVSGGTSRQATAQDLELYEQMRQQQARQPVPVLQHRANPHEYVFFALFDGTAQDVNNPKQLPTNIGELSTQAMELADDPTNRIGYKYVPGIGTQKNPITRTIDGAVAYTWDEKIEEMYRALAKQVDKWQQQDPQAQVRLAEVGYSRGAVLVPGLARLVDQYGIVDPDGLKFGRDAHGNLTVESSRTLIPPGQVAQAVGLFDPVATNMPRNYDARLPPSVLSGFSLLARDEQRELFPHQTIIEPQMSHDRRFLGVPVPGGHANVGGGNREAGLEVMAFNGMADYLNTLTDRPLFEHRPLPTDPAQYTVHQAMGATAAFGLKMDHDGERNLRAELANCTIVDPCRDSEPMNRELANQFEYRRGVIDPAEQAQLQALIEKAPSRSLGAPDERTPHAESAALAAVRQSPAARIDQPGHPGHAMYQQTREHVHDLYREIGKEPDRHADQLAAAAAAQSRGDGLKRVDRVILGDDKAEVFSAQGALGEALTRYSRIQIEPAMVQSLEQSTSRFEQGHAQQQQKELAQQQQQQQEQQEQQAQSRGGISR